MANRMPYFFYTPTWDFHPDGPIKLGNVLTSIKSPELPLYTAQLLAQDEKSSTEKRQVEFLYEKLREGKFSILTRFLSFLGVGVDMSPSGSRRYEFLFPSSALEFPLQTAKATPYSTRQTAAKRSCLLIVS